ncbi:MAG: transglycosylase domain-containing protein, partial [bacterium]
MSGNGSFVDSNTNFFRTRAGATLLGLGIFLLAGGIFLFVISRDLPSLSQLESYKPKLASKVYSTDLKVIYEYYEEKRNFVPLEELPEALVQAAIATEDRKFREHWGFDLRRFVQAAFINLSTLSFREGASTLTQQLARQLYLTLEKKVTRKIKELITAIQIERTYTKTEILEMYLNHMNFGHGSYGAQSAATKYFGKDAHDLSVDECALLIGLLKAPSHYTPLWYPEKARARRNLVLRAMHELNYITDEELAEYSDKPIKVIES